MSNPNPGPPPVGQRFQPGQSGNPGGRPKMKAWRDALKREIERRAAPGAEDKLASGLERIAKIVVDNAEMGERDAWQEIGNRLDGKVAQALIGGEEGDNPISVLQKVERVLVRAQPKD